MSTPAIALISGLMLVALAIRFDLYCLEDLSRADATFYFPPHVWYYLIIFFTPFGGIAYLKIGRPR